MQSLTVDSKTVSKHMSRTRVRHDVILANDTPRMVVDDVRRPAADAGGEKSRRQPGSAGNAKRFSNSTMTDRMIIETDVLRAKQNELLTFAADRYVYPIDFIFTTTNGRRTEFKENERANYLKKKKTPLLDERESKKIGGWCYVFFLSLTARRDGSGGVGHPAGGGGRDMVSTAIVGDGSYHLNDKRTMITISDPPRHLWLQCFFTHRQLVSAHHKNGTETLGTNDRLFHL